MDVHVDTEDGLVLDGRREDADGPARGAALLLHPHPAFGGHMDVWLLPTIAERMAVAGWTSLRLNLRGVEGSEGRQTGGVDEHLDALAGLAHLRTAVPDAPSIAVVGWSFGAMIGLRTGRAADRWVGIATPTREVAEWPLAGPLVPDDPPLHRTAIVGELDRWFGPDTVDVLAPHAVHIVAGADHFFFDRDAEVADLVVASLAPDDGGEAVTDG